MPSGTGNVSVSQAHEHDEAGPGGGWCLILREMRSQDLVLFPLWHIMTPRAAESARYRHSAKPASFFPKSRFHLLPSLLFILQHFLHTTRLIIILLLNFAHCLLQAWHPFRYVLSLSRRYCSPQHRVTRLQDDDQLIGAVLYPVRTQNNNIH